VGVIVVTDSTANLERKYTEKYNIKVASLSVNFPDCSFKETELEIQDFINLLEKYPEIPTSSQPSPADFYLIFQEAVAQGHSVVGIFISTALSGTYSSAATAARMIMEKYPEARIELIDSRATIMQLGYGVITAAKAATTGESLESVAESARSSLERSRLYFIPRTLEYLKKGGRIGGAATLVGTLLKIRPILCVEEGRVAVYDKVRTFEKAVNRILEVFRKEYEEHGIAAATVHHFNNLAEAQKIADYIKKEYKIIPDINEIRAVIGVHAGPGAVGIAYEIKK
jgi:DegV family protein with EDD domain